jgi:hypothetical protein
MKCSNIQLDLALYSDGHTRQTDPVKSHLSECPLCRQRFDEMRQMRTDLRRLSAPEIPSSLRASLKSNINTAIRKDKHVRLPFAPDFRDWLQMQLMPYGVGVLASLVIGVTMLAMLFSEKAPLTGDSTASTGRTTVLLASNSNPFSDDASSDISPSMFAGSRLGFGQESPSVNPHGALIALTRSLIRGGMKDDEVVVVADVFGNGLAQIAEVVEPSRDRRAVAELEKALSSDPAYSPFVPANIEERPETVRVVLKFQNVDVSTTPQRTKRSR